MELTEPDPDGLDFADAAHSAILGHRRDALRRARQHSWGPRLEVRLIEGHRIGPERVRPKSGGLALVSGAITRFAILRNLRYGRRDRKDLMFSSALRRVPVSTLRCRARAVLETGSGSRSSYGRHGRRAPTLPVNGSIPEARERPVLRFNPTRYPAVFAAVALAKLRDLATFCRAPRAHRAARRRVQYHVSSAPLGACGAMNRKRAGITPALTLHGTTCSLDRAADRAEDRLDLAA
jgi:hypothetical protein